MAFGPADGEAGVTNVADYLRLHESQIDVARLHESQASQALRDHLDDKTFEAGQPVLVPVLQVRLVDDLFADLVLDELERAAPDRSSIERVGADRLVVGLRQDRNVSLGRGEVTKQSRIGPYEIHLRGQVVDDLDRRQNVLESLAAATGRGLLGVTLKAELGVGRSDRRSVVPRHVGVERERPRHTVGGHLPALEGASGRTRGPLLGQADEEVVHRSVDRLLQARADARVEHLFAERRQCNSHRAHRAHRAHRLRCCRGRGSCRSRGCRARSCRAWGWRGRGRLRSRRWRCRGGCVVVSARCCYKSKSEKDREQSSQFHWFSSIVHRIDKGRRSGSDSANRRGENQITPTGS